ncbi:MAG: ABC transporter permease [Bryobacteraceae bacterium]|jgi:putative ABC transport system permease protein
MRILRSFGASIRALLAHKLRAVLAIASVAAGVAAVLTTSAIGAGVQQEVLRKTEAMGTNLLVVRPAQVASSAARNTIRGVVTTLKIDDWQAITGLDTVREAVPGFESGATVKWAGNAMKATVLGTTAPYLEVGRFRIREGRFVDEDDNENARRVAVLGWRVDESLFDGADGRGQTIRVRGVPFEVIGVLAEKGALADGSDEDDFVMIPVRTALRRVFNSTWLNPIFVSVRDPEQMSRAEEEIAGVLRVRHRLDTTGKPDDFAIQNKNKVLANQKQLADSLSAFTSGLAAISLLVGGVGILALMLMSVRERTGEVGLRMAVGARPINILIQFLLEAALLSLGGWVAGMAVGAAATAAVALSTDWRVAVPVNAIVDSLAMAALTGIGFGWYPARKASLLPPIQALLAE